MRLLDELREEHQRIESVLGALRGYVARRLEGEAPGDGARFVTFFRKYADEFHHAREEGVLFPALVEHAEVPSTRGPIAAITADHAAMRAMLRELSTLLDAPLDDALRARLTALATAFSRALSLHIDAENSVLFPESEARLRAAGVRELPSRHETDAEALARDDGDALIARWPSITDDGVVRGEGCAICPNFGASCDGVEREWWSDEEWDEFPDHVG